ncbi:MAG TPA: AMMECR1 domain-containing protein [Deltaproteobacteria bacterium]|nr:MAG: AMMECR1 domain-containing protein [Deltaproteobacteria bacterium GWD2_42_10]OGP48939.1 MAG: AMMECR1 domain-containing protein [Deltaproteobacteria bacterium GWF2_42_12]OGQ24608.1 MAG: AMMECR1 domain-containing protein [Deltaproteobacteria bacterium RIFCSPHIGHO2_02_FULL_42_44]OGQ64490.1 MAG: AMMECR1 domain-containing protein [Deltaproteobacteria bacterium RIFCSPLOWO2_12_FULL_42_16]OGQ71901.1 MAG: AMMECR1 domain-containing protein [Deltaproteobacteria bacterium RIFOXYA2_FULL_42_10]HAG499
MPLSKEDKLLLLKIVRETIESYIKTKKIPPFNVSSPALLEHRGAFVSIKTKGNLRGCIGIFASEKPLYLTVVDMAVATATQDPRFIPLTATELSLITIEISCLTALKKVKDTTEIEVGRDGLYIVKGYCRGVLLPQVAVECCWDKETFLEHTCLKAGLPSDGWKDGADIYTFEAEVFGEGD